MVWCEIENQSILFDFLLSDQNKKGFHQVLPTHSASFPNVDLECSKTQCPSAPKNEAVRNSACAKSAGDFHIQVDLAATDGPLPRRVFVKFLPTHCSSLGATIREWRHSSRILTAIIVWRPNHLKESASRLVSRSRQTLKNCLLATVTLPHAQRPVEGEEILAPWRGDLGFSGWLLVKVAAVHAKSLK